MRKTVINVIIGEAPNSRYRHGGLTYNWVGEWPKLSRRKSKRIAELTIELMKIGGSLRWVTK